MMYDVLYGSMFEMYRRQKISSEYLAFYTVTSLVAMEFLNCLSIIVLLAYLNIGSVRDLFYNGGASKAASSAIAILLLAINYAYWRIRARSRKIKASEGARPSWIASAYLAVSVAAAIYASTLTSAFTR
jgi:hypothetical protein